MSWSQVVEFLDENSVRLYVGVVLLIGTYTLIRVSISLRRVSGDRLKRLKRRSLLEAVRTRTPLDHPLEVSQDRGLQSIENSFTVTRQLVVPLIILLTAAIAAIPLLSGVPATAVSAVVAIITVVLGVAARPVIENAMSGLVVSYSRLINIGDTVRVEDMYGTVEDITVTHTTIKLWDWRRLIVPNAKMIQQSFYNYSVFDRFQWAYVEFWVAYDADLQQVEQLAIEAATASDYFADYEKPQLWVTDLGRDGVRCWLAAWAEGPADAWYLRNDIRHGIASRLREAGIPVHMHRHDVTQRQASPPPEDRAA